MVDMTNLLKGIKNKGEGVNVMRKIILAAFVGLLSVGLLYGVAHAAITSACSNCHTMHNSQNGTVVNADGPFGYLVRASCYGCHSGGGIDDAPLIDKTTNMLAGGSFSTSVATTDTRRHDVKADISSLDETTNTTGTPGNSGSTLTIAVGDFDTNFRCAGSKGCHGVHTTTDPDAAMKGYHHGAKTGYRFLHLGTAAYASGNAVTGVGSSTYEAGGATSVQHNVYGSGTTGISELCAECHGQFHGSGNTGSATPFTRHPTDNLLSDASGWTMASVTVDYDNTPFAFDSPSGKTTTEAYTTSAANVSCLSCHRAHGSAYVDILRWEYDVTPGSGTTTKCLACHHLQR